MNTATAKIDVPQSTDPVFTISLGEASNPGAITKQIRSTFAQLAEQLTTARARNRLYHGKLTAAEFRAADKPTKAADKACTWFTFAEFKGNRRRKPDVLSVGAIGFDVEGINITADVLRERLGGLEFFAVSSYQHLIEPNFQRWRVVVNLKTPITDTRHFGAVHAAIAARIGVESTEAAKDASRLWYIPGCPRDMVGQHDAFYQPGEPFDPATVAVEPASAVEHAQVAAAPTEGAAIYVKSLLDRIKLPADKGCRDEWLVYGMAAHHHTAGSEEGFQVWHAWSMTQPGYASEEDCHNVWQSFGKRQNGAPAHTVGVLQQAAYAQTGITAEDCSFETVPEAQAAAAAPKPVYRCTIRAGDVETTGTVEVPYVIKGWLPRQKSGIMFGRWGSGKTFLGISMAAHVAAGKPWFGRRVRQAGALVFSWEGDIGMARRLRALKLRYPDWPWQTMPLAIELMRGPLISPNGGDGAGRAQFDAALRGFREEFGADPGLVLIDTLRRALGGSPSDPRITEPLMGLAADVAKNRNACVLSLHHPGHTNTDRATGDSGIESNADISIRVEMKGGSGLLVNRKQRDDALGELYYKLEVVQLGHDADGDPVSTCVAIQQAENPAAAKLSDSQRGVLDVIRTLAGDGDTVARERVLEACKKAGYVKEGDAGRKHLHKILTVLAARDYLAFDKDTIRPLEQGAKAFFEEDDGAGD